MPRELKRFTYGELMRILLRPEYSDILNQQVFAYEDSIDAAIPITDCSMDESKNIYLLSDMSKIHTFNGFKINCGKAQIDLNKVNKMLDDPHLLLSEEDKIKVGIKAREEKGI